MRVVIVGASGNAGTALLRRLRSENDVEIAGVARRPPEPVDEYRDVEWHAVDVAAEGAADRLAGIFRGAAAVVNLAWQIQPSHDPRRLFRTNVLVKRPRAARRAVGGGSSRLPSSSRRRPVLRSDWRHLDVRVAPALSALGGTRAFSAVRTQSRAGREGRA